MSGSATFTTVMSSSSMKIAVQTAISVHHLRSRPSMPRGYFAGRLSPHRNRPFYAAGRQRSTIRATCSAFLA